MEGGDAAVEEDGGASSLRLWPAGACADAGRCFSRTFVMPCHRTQPYGDFSLDGLAKAVNPPQGVSRNGGRDYCDACFSGVYDVALPDQALQEEIAGAGAFLMGKAVP